MLLCTLRIIMVKHLVGWTKGAIVMQQGHSFVKPNIQIEN
jgi:hypothetical protein